MTPDDAPATGAEAATPAPANPPASSPPSPAAAESAGKPKGSHRGRKIALVVLVLLGVAVAAGLWWALSPTKPGAYDAGVALSTSEPNTLAYAALANIGIDGPIVSVPDGKHIEVTYDLRRSPADAAWLNGLGSSATPVAPDDLQRAAIGALAAALPDAMDLKIEQLDNLTHRTTWSVAMSDVVAFFDGELSLEQFEARITKA